MANYMDRFKRGKDAEEARMRALGKGGTSKAKPELKEVKVTAKRKPTPKPKLEEVKVTAKRKPSSKLKPKSEGERARDIALGRQAPPKKAPKAKTSKFGQGSSKTVMHRGKKMANVTAEQLKKTGMSLREYMNQWNKTGKRPS